MCVVVKGAVMTAEEKLKILDLSNKGMNSKEIAAECKIAASYVRKILSLVSPEQTFCLECGCVMDKGRFKPKKFCSDKCKREYYKKHPECVHKKKFKKHICPCCHKEFLSYGKPHRKYCSRTCSSRSRFI